MASFPTSIKTYTAVVAGQELPYDVVQSLQDEITAIETGLETSTSYTPTWTNGVLGNGTLVSSYIRRGKTCRFEINITMGSTTTYGGGSVWTFSLPLTAADTNGFVGSVHAVDQGTAHHTGVCFLASTTTLQLVREGTTSGFHATEPHTWANTDQLQICGEYRVA